MSIRFQDLEWTPVVKKLSDKKNYFFGTIGTKVDITSIGELISTAVKDKIKYYLVEKPVDKIEVQVVSKATKIKSEKKVKVKKVEKIKKKPIKTKKKVVKSKKVKAKKPIKKVKAKKSIKKKTKSKIKKRK